MSLATAILTIIFCCSLPLRGAWAQNVLIRVCPDGSLMIQEKSQSLPQKPPPLASNKGYDLVVSKGKMYVLKKLPLKPAQVPPVTIISRPKLKSPSIGGSLAPPGTSTGLTEIIKKHAAQNGVDARLVQLVVEHESGGNPQAVSPKGAQGLMQLMPGTATMVGVMNPFDPEQNIAGGIKYLKHCLERFNNDVSLALAAYNAGPENVNRYQGIPPFNETRNYVSNIMRNYTGQAPSFPKTPPDTHLTKSSPSPVTVADGKKLSQPFNPLACLPSMGAGGTGQVNVAQIGKLKIITIKNDEKFY